MGGEEEERKRGGRRRKRRAEDSQCDGAGRDRAESRRAIPLGFGVPNRDRSRQSTDAVRLQNGLFCMTGCYFILYTTLILLSTPTILHTPYILLPCCPHVSVEVHTSVLSRCLRILRPPTNHRPPFPPLRSSHSGDRRALRESPTGNLTVQLQLR